jgi:predicted esterase
MTRRAFVAASIAAPLAFAAACTPTEPEFAGPARLRLSARKPTRGTVTGTDVLYGQDLHRAYLRVPLSYTGEKTPLIIALHGAGGRGDTFAAAFGSRTDALGAIVLAPDSLGLTWDFLSGGASQNDVEFINVVLDQTFARCNIDASRIAILGFSDGASYAVTLGLSNADQLTGVVGFSPGFYELSHPRGKTEFFISHGITDNVLPIDETSRKIVSDLRVRGQIVTYTEFEGGHVVPNAIADAAMTWLSERYDAT